MQGYLLQNAGLFAAKRKAKCCKTQSKRLSIADFEEAYNMNNSVKAYVFVLKTGLIRVFLRLKSESWGMKICESATKKKG